MPPISVLSKWLTNTLETSAVILFSNTTCSSCVEVKEILKKNDINYGLIELDKRNDCNEVQALLVSMFGVATVPQLFVRGSLIGNLNQVAKLDKNGSLKSVVEKSEYDYDLVVIGGGSGGLAASKEAVSFGAKTAVLDYVEPTPIGTKWGLGGTCVNVGCIPKKLMHQAALLQYSMKDAYFFGWNIDADKIEHNWSILVENVQSYIKSLNWNYKTSLKAKKVDYFNACGELVDPHKVKMYTNNSNNNVSTITAKRIILSTGERPNYPNIPGAKEFGITSDDLFSLQYFPGKTLIVGASYVALECAGFLATVGADVTVMVRSILLRGFDQEMADLIGQYMEKNKVKFIRSCVPTELSQVEPVDKDKNKPGWIKVLANYDNGEKYQEKFNTVIFAIGRNPHLEKMNVKSLDMKLDNAGRVICSDDDRSSVDSIYVIGDISSGKPQLTPVAIQAGRLLARRLFAGADEKVDYVNVPTSVFTPIEYGACGLSESDAKSKFGENDIEVYHSNFKPLEWTVPNRDFTECYVKIICHKKENERVVGFHYVGPNAGEITQGFAVAMKIGATKNDFSRTIGIHPTCAEIFTTMNVTKKSGKSVAVTGC